MQAVGGSEDVELAQDGAPAESLVLVIDQQSLGRGGRWGVLPLACLLPTPACVGLPAPACSGPPHGRAHGVFRLERGPGQRAPVPTPTPTPTGLPAQCCWFSGKARRGPHSPTKCPALRAPDLPARPSWSLFSLPFLGHNITHQRRGPGAFRPTRKTPRAAMTCTALSGDGGCCGVRFHGFLTCQTDAGPACSRGPVDVVTEDCRSSGNITCSRSHLGFGH